MSRKGGVEVAFSEREARELMRWLEALLLARDTMPVTAHRLLIRMRSKIAAARGVRLLPLERASTRTWILGPERSAKS